MTPMNGSWIMNSYAEFEKKPVTLDSVFETIEVLASKEMSYEEFEQS